MRVALVGTGLIGASVGLAAKQAGAEVVGFDPDPGPPCTTNAGLPSGLPEHSQ